MADTAYDNLCTPVSAISLSLFHLPFSLFIAVTLLRNQSIAPNNRFFTFIINRYIVLYIISVPFCCYPLRFVSSFLRSSPLKGDSSCLIVSTLKTNLKHCPSLRGTSAVSRANGTEGVISKFSSSLSSSFSLETLFPSAKIIHHGSGINRIISHLRSWKIAKNFVLLYQTKLFTAAQG